MEAFKSSLVGKSCNLKDEIEKLPEELRKRWIDREFRSFLVKFKDIISNVLTDERRMTGIFADIQHKINLVLPFLSQLGYSFDNEVHKRIHECYDELSKLCSDLERLPGEFPRRVASSSNKYLVNILCPERKIFCTDDFMKQHLKFISGRWEEQTLKVEMEFKSHEQRDLSVSRFYGHEYDLQQIALDFLGKSYIHPLNDTTFPPLPGVYLIYHVGKTQLYEGSQVSPSTRYPVYVGMSQTNIANDLEDHRQNIEKASEPEQSAESQETDKEGEKEKERTERGSRREVVKLELIDFVVRFMIVDIEHYAHSIEGILIEHFNPVWNRQTMAFSFGNAKDSGNLWYKFHISKDPKTIENVLRDLKI